MGASLVLVSPHHLRIIPFPVAIRACACRLLVLRRDLGCAAEILLQLVGGSILMLIIVPTGFLHLFHLLGEVIRTAVSR